MRVLVLADRISDRGGADWHLLGVLDALARDHELSLARISHKPSTATDDSTVPARRSPSGLLNVSSDTPPSPSGPSTAHSQHSHPPRDEVFEICGLGVGRIDERCNATLACLPQVACLPHVVSALAERVDCDDSLPDLDTLVAQCKPNALHLHNVVNPAVLRWAAGRAAVLTIQDHRFFCPGQGKVTSTGARCSTVMSRDVCADCFTDDGYFDDIYRLTQARLEAAKELSVVVLSEYMKRELVAAGLQEHKIEVTPPFVHGLDPDAAAEGPSCVLFVGRLTRSKGIDDAVAAWKRSGLDLPLLFAGTGPERDRLQRAGHQVLGWLDRAQLARRYKAARVVVVPSRWQEPFGIVGLEALSMGVPVAAWDSGGIREWHPGGVGLVPWGDIDALAQALTTLASPPGA